MFTEEKDSKVHSENEPKSKIATTKDQETASIRFSQSSGELEVTNGKKSSPKKKSKTTYVPNRDLSYILKRHNPPLVSWTILQILFRHATNYSNK